MTRPPSLFKQKNFFRRHLDLILILSVFTAFFYAHVLTQPVSPFSTKQLSDTPFERHNLPTVRFPFIAPYFLMVPEDYQPQKYSYPLVVLLHGASGYIDSAEILTRADTRANFPAFVLIPVAPFGSVWAMPQGASFRPQALGLMMKAVRAIQHEYRIDESRIYVSGVSMGGVGTYGAVAYYHNVFAAAAPMDGTWDSIRAHELDDVPLWVFHAGEDSVIPVQGDRAMVEALYRMRRDVFYTEYAGMGHGAAAYRAYESPAFWNWLFAQKKAPAGQNSASKSYQ